MWYVIDKESRMVVGRYYSFYAANKLRDEYDGAVLLAHR